MVKIAPSILAADSSCLKDAVQKIEKAGADYIHFDVMDGHFVPNITFGPQILKDLKFQTNLPFDVHLMVENPEKFIPWFAEAKADMITFHVEATNNVLPILNLIKKYNIKAGLSLKPDTNIHRLDPFLDKVDLVLVMSVNPGFGGQSFIPSAIDKIRYLNQIPNRSFAIEVDGGITPVTASQCIIAGSDILVAGTSVFKDGLYEKNIQTLKGV